MKCFKSFVSSAYQTPARFPGELSSRKEGYCMDLRGSQIFLQPGVSPTPLSLFSSAPGFKPQGEMSLHSAEEHLLGGFSSSCVSLLLREGPHCPGSQPRVSEPQKAPGHEAPKGNPKAAPRLRSRLQYPQSYGMLGLTTTLRSLPPDLVPFLHTSGCFVSKRRCPPPPGSILSSLAPASHCPSRGSQIG